MIKRAAALITTLSLALITQCAFAANSPYGVEVFDMARNKRLYKMFGGIEFHAIDANKNLLQEISDRFKNEAIAAYQQGEEISEDYFIAAYKAYEDNFSVALKPIARATILDIKKIPAISFESGKYVVYGSRNISDAFNLYHKAKRAKYEQQK